MKNLLESIKNSGKMFSYGERMRPFRDWFILIAIFGAFCTASMVWNLWLFAKITAGETIGVATTTPVQQAPAFDVVEGLFVERGEERTRYIETYLPQDPSR